MKDIPFAPGALEELLAMLGELSRSVRPDQRFRVEALSNAVTAYERGEQRTFHDLLAAVPSLADELHGVNESAARAICEHIKTHCRGCMFHVDTCFMNVIFLVFKSIEMNRVVAPNRVRPAMRIVLPG